MTEFVGTERFCIATVYFVSTESCEKDSEFASVQPDGALILVIAGIKDLN
jgi:hypothetical protein